MACKASEARAKRLEELIEGKEEFCCLCLKTMGFPKSLHIYAAIRFKDGAGYVGDGMGQVCGDCEREANPPVRREMSGAS